jgi:3-oxoacyl-[acyl-carrier-protein] synthase-3
MCPREDRVSANSIFTHYNVGVLSVEAIEAPDVVTSTWIDDQLAETYTRTGVNPGTLSNLVGIDERRWWPEDVSFDQAAAMAGRAAITSAKIDPQEIGMLISTSVCKHHLEPSVACAVHHHLDMAPSCLNFDVGNACLGFINGMQIAAAAIDNGAIDYALIVDGEGSRYTQQQTIRRLQEPTTTAEDVFAEFATLTLGSGAAAMVLGQLDRHPSAHRLVGGVARADTRHHNLCVGDLDQMRTDTHALLTAGLEVAEAAWAATGGRFDWEGGLDWYVLHQISQVHTALICERLGIDPERVPLTFPRYGNVGPAAIPITLAGIADEVAPGERVLCLGIGSGLNTCAIEIVW